MLNLRWPGRKAGRQLDEWEIYLTDEVRDWVAALDERSHKLVAQAIDILADRGPSLGRPMVDHVEYSTVQNLKELRPGSAGRSEVRILFVFDPWRSAILLVATATRPVSGSSGTGTRSRLLSSCWRYT